MKRVYRIMISGIFVVVLFIGGCGTPTPPIPVAPTATICPTITWDSPKNQSSMVFVLIDGTKGYLENGYISDTRNILKESLKSFIQSGDRIVLAWVNQKTLGGFNSSIFFYSTFIFDVGEVEPTPTLPIPPTSFLDTENPTATPRGQLGKDQAQEEIATAKAVEEQEINNYVCELGKTINTSQEIYQQIEEIRLNNAEIFTSEIFNIIPISKDEYGDNTLNPFLESVKMASEFMNTQCPITTYENCILLIFSNMNDPRRVKETIEDPDLTSNFNKTVDVVSLIFDCKFKDGGCETRIKDWERHFSAFEAKKFRYILNPFSGTELQNQSMIEELSLNLFEIKKDNDQ